MNSQQWCLMIQYQGLVDECGNTWWHTRKQVPPEWLEFLAQPEHEQQPGLAQPLVAWQGKRKYTDLPGEHGHTARVLIERAQEAVQEHREKALCVDMNDVKETMGNLIQRQTVS